MAQQPRMSSGNKAANLTHVERKESRRAVLYILVAILAILVIGFVAGVIDNAIRTNITTNAFVENSREMLLVIASTAPWIAFFILLCSSWVFIADRLFVRWNRVLGEPNEKDKGIIYEIVHDNNSAAALVLLVPMLLIALGLIYVALLNLPYNLPTTTINR